MAEIKSDIHPELAVFTVEGALSVYEVIDTLNTYYPNLVKKHIIWDFTNGDLSDMAIADFEMIAKVAKKIMTPSKERKTAFVASRDLEYGLMRMYSVFGELKLTPTNYSVFKSLAEAKAWIDDDT